MVKKGINYSNVRCMDESPHLQRACHAIINAICTEADELNLIPRDIFEAKTTLMDKACKFFRQAN